MTDRSAPFAALGGKTPEDLFGGLATPCYILDEAALRRNGEILAGVAARTGCRVLLAQKAFSNYDCYPVLAPYLAGTEASGLFEARLGWEQLPEKEVHVFCGAYREQDFDELLNYAGHIVFNSPAQLAKFGPKAKAAGKSLGLRINPECSTQEGHAIYDPCAPGSRLGTTRAQWDRFMTPALLDLLDGLHFHTLCEQDSDALEITLQAVTEKFGDVLPKMKWLNMGGGHHVTRPDYDIPRLERCVRYARETWGVIVYLEPGEAWALNAGFLAARVLDLTENNGVRNAILDCSAACHMPDVIEMPYMPPLYGAAEATGNRQQATAPLQGLPLEGKVPPQGADEVVLNSASAPHSCHSERSEESVPPVIAAGNDAAAERRQEAVGGGVLDAPHVSGVFDAGKTDCHDQLYISSGSQICCTEACIFGPSLKSADWSRNGKTHVYRLGGPSCLSGDVIGDYEFDHPLEIGDLVLFGDLAIYSTCKNNTFNGMPLPQIWRRAEDGTLEQLSDFGYRDFKYRLGR